MNKEITVKDVLNHDDFHDFKVLAGKNGLDKNVESITIIDSPDPFPWAKGGEIVLSSGYVFKSNYDDFSDILIKMQKSGIVALFIKVKRFFDKLPGEIIELANEINFPIVEVPLKMAFIDVINPTLSKIIHMQSECIKKSQEIHKTFTNLVINNDNTISIINELANILDEDILYYDLHLEKSYYSNRIDKIPEDMEKLSLKEVLNTYHNYSIGINKEVYGYIIYMKTKEEDVKIDYYDALPQANTALILDTQKKISSMQIEDRHKNEFVQDIIMNNIKYKEEVRKRAQMYGWDFSETTRLVLVVDIDNFKAQYLKLENKNSNDNLECVREKIIRNVIKIMKYYFKDSVYATLSDSIVFLLKPQGCDLKFFNSQLNKCCGEIRLSTLEKYKYSATIGIGEIKEDIMHMHKSYEEAQLAIKIGRVLYEKDSTIFYNKLGIFKLLYSVYENKDFNDFSTSYIGKIIEYDENHNSELLKTLTIILENDWNLKVAADVMFIHYNTMKYRYRKISSIINEDLNHSDVRLNLALALKIYQMRN
ncbi:PucR family transcriptional regulator [Terrisporobacter sp.]